MILELTTTPQFVELEEANQIVELQTVYNEITLTTTNSEVVLSDSVNKIELELVNNRVYLYTTTYRVDLSLQGETTTSSGESGVSDHGDLTGLSDDDHIQYLTVGRADLLYAPSGESAVTHHGSLTGLSDDDHPQYLTEGRADLLYAPSGETGVADHGALTGLADDDHTQYHTDGRGDVRYSQTSHVHNAYAGHILSGEIHFTEASIHHGDILNVGTTTHALIDSHIIDSTIHTTPAEENKWNGHTVSGEIHFTVASIDHGTIAGLADNDHPQYSQTSHVHNAYAGHMLSGEIHVTTADKNKWNGHTASGEIHFTVASIDHGSIAGLGDNDHPQYSQTSHVHNAYAGHMLSGEIHFTEASINHLNILNKGTNTHAQIDGHISSGEIHVTAADKTTWNSHVAVPHTYVHASGEVFISGEVSIKAGTNITLTQASHTITINSSGGSSSGETNHANLTNLSYALANHTGFAQEVHVHNAYAGHMLSGEIHRIINDSATSSTSLWSSTKVSGEIALRLPTTTTAANLTIGTPTDGSWIDGLNSWISSTSIANALDDCNELFTYLAPADADSMDAHALTMANTTLYSGYLSAGTGQVYKTGVSAGDACAYIIIDRTFTLTTPGTTTHFNKADEGTINWYTVNGSAAYGAVSDSVNLASNFQEANRGTTQSTTPWTTGQLSVTSVGWYNSFPKWQKGNATLTITATQAPQGYCRYKITHEGISSTQTSNDYEVFVDTGASTPTCTSVVVTDATPSYTYLSGIKYYGVGTTFNVACVGNYCFANTYVLNTIVLTGLTASWISSTNLPWNDATVSGVSSPPNLSNTMTVTNKVVTSITNVMTQTGGITATPYRPGVTGTLGSSTAELRINGYLNTVSGTSTDIAEYFDDEWYRIIPGTSIDATYAAGATGGWNSTKNIVSGEAAYITGLQTVDGTLKYPSGNYSTGKPTGNPTYVGATGNRTYIRHFYVGTGKQNFTWTIGGSTVDFVAVATGPSGNNLTFEMSAPATTKDAGGSTVWKDCYVAYTSDTAVGCYVSGTRDTGSDWVTTLGTKSTSTSSGTIAVRITASSSWAGNLSGLSVVAA